MDQHLTADLRRALDRAGGPVGLAVGAAPAVVFVTTDAVAGLTPALVASATAAVVGCAVRLARREPARAAVAGLLVAAVCASVAAVAGEARAFFLPTTLLPGLFVLAYVISLAARRPLTGVLTNALSGGPRDWPRHPALLRVHTLCSLVGLAMAAANLAVRVSFYRADEPAALAAVQVTASSLFAVHLAVTLVLARRATARLVTAPAATTVR